MPRLMRSLKYSTTSAVDGLVLTFFSCLPVTCSVLHWSSPGVHDFSSSQSSLKFRTHCLQTLKGAFGICPCAVHSGHHHSLAWSPMQLLLCSHPERYSLRLHTVIESRLCFLNPTVHYAAESVCTNTTTSSIRARRIRHASALQCIAIHFYNGRVHECGNLSI